MGAAGEPGEQGMSMLEVLVAVVLLAIGLLAVAASGGLSLREVSDSRTQLRSWTGVGRIADSLTALGWGGVDDGSATVDDVELTWTVASPSAGLERVDLVVDRPSAAGFGTVTDTVYLYLAKP